MRRRTALLTICMAVMVAEGALACGESLYRVGRGVLYRQYTAPLPGRILVVARTDSELAMAERLAAAGHDIHVVPDPSAIGAEIANSEHDFDLVLAYFGQRIEVESQTGSTSIRFLPVALDSNEEAQAREVYDRFVPDQASVKTFLRTIHSVLRSRA